MNNVIFRLREGETSWTKITNLPDLRFLISEESALIIGSQTDLRRSLDEGETWQAMTDTMKVGIRFPANSGGDSLNYKDIPILATAEPKLLQLGNRDSISFINVGEVSMPETAGMKNQSLNIQHVSAVGHTIYLLLNDGRLLRSTANGSWNITEASGLSEYDISADSMAALSDRMVCVGDSAGIFRWTDSDSSWKRINNGFIGTMVWSLVSFKNELYASTYNRNGVFKSVDGGNRWMPIHVGLPTTDVGALAVSGGSLYLGVNEENFTGTDDPTTGGIYRLGDDRNSWIPVQTEMRTAYVENERRRGYHQMYSVEVLVISGDNFYVIAQMGSGSRLFRWRSGERYWTDISPHPEDWIHMGENEITGLAVAKETIYIVADMDLYRSRNSGDTWSRLEIRAAPSSRYLTQITGAEVLGRAVFVSSRESGVFWSTDKGKNWESVNSGLPKGYSSELHAIGNALYATDSAQGIYRFRDGRDTWEFVKPSVSNMLSSALTIADGILYAGMGESGVYRIALED